MILALRMSTRSSFCRVVWTRSDRLDSLRARQLFLKFSPGRVVGLLSTCQLAGSTTASCARRWASFAYHPPPE
eukprot:5523897-Pyramimonas_sp.AAC.1